MTELQINFIRRAAKVYDLIILEELFGVPDEMSRVPDWAHSEIHDLAEFLDKDSDELANVAYAYLRDLMDNKNAKNSD